APAAGATESWTWPSSGTLTVYGHGYGHGHGMSQWGAYGAATQGKTYQQIMAFYYPGTSLQQLAESSLRILIQEDTDNDTRVAPASGLTATTADGPAVLPTTLSGATVTSWRAVRLTAAGLTVQGLTGSTWHAYAIGTKTEHTGEVRFNAGSGLVRVLLGSTYREFRGGVIAVPVGTSTGEDTVVLSTMTNYLASVVPSEMPSSWAAAALRAQAVAARTYASYEIAHKPAGRYYDTCDTTSCQVFKGVADYNTSGTLLTRHEATSSTSAVAATAGWRVMYGGAYAFTQFSASNGGWTTAGSVPYLAAFPDPYDGVHASTAHSWTDTITAASLQSAYPSIGTLRSVSLSRDGHGEWGGRVTSITLTGTSGSVTVSGESLRSPAGLKSSWWAPASTGWGRYNLLFGPGDWNGDGRVDLFGRTPDGQLWFTAGLTGGTGPPTLAGAGWQVFTAILGPGDLTGDGHPDVLARLSTGPLRLYPGNGTGGFLPATQFGAGWQAFTAMVGPGDLTGDGKPDVLVRTSAGTLRVYPGTGGGGFSTPTEFGAGWGVYTMLVGPGDLTGDGKPDLLARTSDGTLYLYAGTGTGGFTARTLVGTGWQIYNALVGTGDWDLDGKADLVARSTGGTLYLYTGNGTGGFHPRVQIGSA
ncbi:MAG: stage sporulation protein, partial [Actinomycetota bacterium]|nr:stage sporulation protein [Actinomycetota bacterium]